MLDTRETILTLARATAQAHGYGGLSFRELAKAVGIKSASIHYHFPTKADLGAALARRYTADAAAALAGIAEATPKPAKRLRRYTDIFRRALEHDNPMCLASYMAAEYDDLPDAVKQEVAAFANLNIAWLTDVLIPIDTKAAKARAHAIYAAIGGAQLGARTRNHAALYDDIIETYRKTGLIPD